MTDTLVGGRVHRIIEMTIVIVISCKKNRVHVIKRGKEEGIKKEERVREERGRRKGIRKKREVGRGGGRGGERERRGREGGKEGGIYSRIGETKEMEVISYIVLLLWSIYLDHES